MQSTMTRRTTLLHIWTLLLSLCIATHQQVQAHEPLWGETPIVFGSGLIHPEVEYSFMDIGSTNNGGMRARMFMQEYMVQYAPKPSMNVILEVPYFNNRREQIVNGQLRKVPFVGLGDITLKAKSRVHAKQEEGLSIQQTAIYGF